jgi:hypothetical protein
VAKLTDGFRTVIGFTVLGTGVPTAPGGQSTLFFFEKEVQPPDLELGKIDITTMRNTRLRTEAPKSLISYGECTLQVQYDPNCYNPVPLGFPSASVMGVIGTLAILFPDGAIVTKLAWLDSFKPTSHKEGEMPTAEIKFCFPNTSGLNSGTSSGFPGALGGSISTTAVEGIGSFSAGTP